ncbi:hypothetical protein SDC9_139856 [bioreactor metagenome]|uniref:Uncharacterized protein n=1 Tax=bioreactor metagenome TaxID=1076179 RepID=A0A645DTA3_9ZZZZ
MPGKCPEHKGYQAGAYQDAANLQNGMHIPGTYALVNKPGHKERDHYLHRHLHGNEQWRKKRIPFVFAHAAQQLFDHMRPSILFSGNQQRAASAALSVFSIIAALGRTINRSIKKSHFR